MAAYARLLHRRHLQTPIRCYTHPDTRRRVTIVATIHVGLPGYFAALRTAIDDLEAADAVVHREASAPELPTATSADFTTDEQQLLSELARAGKPGQRYLEELGWITDFEGLGYPPHWQCHDLSPLQLIRRIGLDTMRRMVDMTAKMNRETGNPRRDVARYELATTVGLRVLASTLGQRLSPPAEAVVLDERNAVALNGVDSTDRDTVLVWGAKHLPGLDAGLVERGFVPSRCHEKWYTVAELRTVRSALWRFIAAPRRRPESVSR